LSNAALNPGTYAEIFNPSAELFAGTQDPFTEISSRSYGPLVLIKGRPVHLLLKHPANVTGVIKVREEQLIFSDVYVPCELCKGKTFTTRQH